VERIAADGDASSDELAEALREAEARVRRIVPSLDADRDTLEQDNAALAQQERALWTEIQTLRRYASLAERIDDLVEARAGALEAGDPVRARHLREDALFSVRRRRRDLLLQLAVATQAYAALRLIEQDNLEVIWAIRVASTTTVTAMRSAMLVARIAGERRLPDGPDIVDLAGAWTSVVAAIEAAESRRRRTLAEVDARSGD
jgi:uncharacterized protein YaaN involved in tellurite resistance